MRTDLKMSPEYVKSRYDTALSDQELKEVGDKFYRDTAEMYGVTKRTPAFYKLANVRHALVRTDKMIDTLRKDLMAKPEAKLANPPRKDRVYLNGEHEAVARFGTLCDSRTGVNQIYEYAVEQFGKSQSN